ncbi:MAG TPA: M20/M25/M40 family metallo-hydrolase [Thermoanaerobaculia bacterium]|nr:M20/M25/M40 family metallo-hydrolase [Thermoanaerobaculia bacterium]
MPSHDRQLRGAILLALATLVSPGVPTAAAQPSSLYDDLDGWRRQNEVAVLQELVELLAIPNLASDETNIRRNAQHLVGMLERRGARARLLEVEGSPPAVYGELPADGEATRTVVLYAHYDGQPVDESAWASPPWHPTLRAGSPDSDLQPIGPGPAAGADERRIYGRSSSDDKSPIVAMLAAIDALKARGYRRSVHLKFFFEGEEEAGSPHLEAMLRAHRELLEADLWLFCDGPVHQSRRQQVVLGVRGVMGAELTVYGPLRELHSGHYGNWAPNPGALLVDLLGSLRDADGKILVDGFYDPVRPQSAGDRAALDAAPAIDDAIRQDLGLARTEAANAPLAERVLLPALNVRGIAVGAVGAAARNSIPTAGRASLDFRLVPDQTPELVRSQVEAHLDALGWHLVHDADPDLATRLAHPRIVRLDWEGGYRAQRTQLEHPAAVAVLEVADAWSLRASGTDLPAVRAPILGGSLPMYLFEEVLRAPLIVLPMVNHDNAQHAANENLRLQNLWDGISLYASVVARLGKAWD